MKQSTSHLRKYFPEFKSFKDIQEDAIENILNQKNTLCLMRTGSGKSLIYQIAGLGIGKTTIVISPLIALIDQQCEKMNSHGFSAISLHNISGNPKKYYDTIGNLFRASKVDFLFISPERFFTDGYLEYILKNNKTSIGLIVVDEVHCVSQWGHSFRTSFKMIPDQLERIFGKESIPTRLCLTATLNAMDENEIRSDFEIEKTDCLRSKTLWRDDLDLDIQSFEDEPAKKEYLIDYLSKNKEEKTIVYAHRISGKWGTRQLSSEFKELGFSCEYYDSEASDTHKASVLSKFESGELRIVFATSAFGMGIDISDIRRVVHYLLPESIEQYYQEVGRAGRDNLGAKCLLMFTPTNIKVRTSMIQNSMPNREEIENTFKKLDKGGEKVLGTFNLWENLSDESNEKTALYYLIKYKILKVSTKGFLRINSFKTNSKTGSTFNDYLKATKVGLTINIIKKLNMSITKMMNDVYEQLYSGIIGIAKSPEKAIFYFQKETLGEDILDKIENETKSCTAYRLEGFEQLIDLIENPTDLKKRISQHLNL